MLDEEKIKGVETGAAVNCEFTPVAVLEKNQVKNVIFDLEAVYANTSRYSCEAGPCRPWI